MKRKRLRRKRSTFIHFSIKKYVHMCLNNKSSTFFSKSLSVTHRKNRVIQEAQKNKKNDEIFQKVKNEYFKRNQAKLMLQEALISKFTSKPTMAGSVTRNILSSALERSKRGDIALLGKLPDFTINDKFDEDRKRKEMLKKLRSSLTFANFDPKQILRQGTSKDVEEDVKRNLNRYLQNSYEKQVDNSIMQNEYKKQTIDRIKIEINVLFDKEKDKLTKILIGDMENRECPWLHNKKSEKIRNKYLKRLLSQ